MCYLAHVCLLALAGCQDRPADYYPGYVEADYVRLASPLAGTLAHSYVARGVRVEAGASAFVLEQDNERAARLEAEARLARAQAALADLEKGKRPPELAVVQAQLAQAQAALALSRAALERDVRLQKSGFVSPARLDELRAAARRDDERVRELQAQLTVARLGARLDAVQAARADVGAAQAQLDQANWKLAQKTVKIPLGATVADVLYREGELVPAGAPVVSLLAPGYLRARFFVPERRLGAIKLGQEMRLQCDGCAGPVAARVSYIAREAEYTAPLIYSQESRANLVFLIEATPYGPGADALHPGQPLEVRPAQERQ
ncbi:MAG TPA: HlyD family efflux transporter periplasmic adaptor subunit [Telluria sp.]|nr:HlyD family efflux transporter periplasmic adaptor subunit [Telluria sp.]